MPVKQNIFFDTHCHLNFKAFSSKREKIIQEAKDKGIKFILIPGTNIKTSQKAVQIAEEHKNIFAAIGLHPHHAFEIKKKEVPLIISQLKKMIQSNKVVAVGEIGLDKHQYQKTQYEAYLVDKNFLEKQKLLFAAQIKLAIQYNKPVIIHSREASKEMIKVLEENWSPQLKNKLVFHCAEPSRKILNFAFHHQAFIGVDGDISYYQQKRDFLKNYVPLKMIVLETDSPYLSPYYRGKKLPFPNQPKNIILVAQLLAQEKKVSLEELARITTKNARQLFKIQS